MLEAVLRFFVRRVVNLVVDRFFKKVSKQVEGADLRGAAILQQPETLHLERFREDHWLDRGKVAAQVNALRGLGFRAIGSFRVPEMKSIELVGLGHPERGFAAVVYENQQSGAVTCDIIALYRDGGSLTVSTSPDAGLPQMPRREKMFLKPKTPLKKLLQTLEQNLVTDDVAYVHPGNFRHLFEKSYAEETAWRRQAVEGGSLAIVRDPQLDALCEPLFGQIRAGNVAGIQAFRVEGIRPEGRDKRCYTPLMAAVETGNAAIVRAVLDAGADPNAVAPGMPGVEPVNMKEDLAEMNKAVDEIENEGGKALMRGLQALAVSSSANQPAEVTALGLAIHADSVELARILVQAGARFDNPPSLHPLGYAASQDKPELVRLLLELGAPVDYAGTASLVEAEEGHTALGTAVEEGHLRIVEILLAAGADPNRKSFEEYPILLAATVGHRALVERLTPLVPKKLQKKAAKLLAKTEKEIARDEALEAQWDDDEGA